MEQYNQHSNEIFRAFFKKVKQLDISQKEWDQKLSLLQPSDQAAVRDSIFRETERQALFDEQSRSLELDKRDISSVSFISEIQSLCNEQQKIAAKTAFASPPGPTSIPPKFHPNARFDYISNKISNKFADFRSEKTQEIMRFELEAQIRTVADNNIEQ